jgi:hypothetical protein
VSTLQRIILSFGSTHDAIACQRHLDSASVAYQVIPTPTEITADCGIALSLSASDRQEAIDALGTSRYGITHATLKEGRLYICNAHVD